MRSKLLNFNPLQNQPDEWIDNFETVIKNVLQSEELEPHCFSLLPFFFSHDNSVWLFKERNSKQFSWTFFKQIFETEFWTKFWKSKKDAIARKKTKDENYHTFFEEKINLFQFSFPELNSSSIIKLCISSLSLDEVDQFQKCLSYDVEMFLRFVKGVDLALEAGNKEDAADDISDDTRGEAASNVTNLLNLLLKAANNLTSEEIKPHTK